MPDDPASWELDIVIELPEAPIVFGVRFKTHADVFTGPVTIKLGNDFSVSQSYMESDGINI